MQNGSQVVNTKPNGRAEQERAQRRRRDDMSDGRLRNLTVSGNLDPNYVYRWINDDPGRIHALTVNDDYDLVTYAMTGETPAEKDKGVGSAIERIADKATGKRTILVRKPRDYYLADKAKEQSSLDEFDAAIKRGESKDPNSLQASDPSKTYVPRGGIVVQDGRKG